MKTKLAFALIVAVALTAAVVAQQGGGKAGGGGRRGGMMGAAGFVEQSWAALCFEINLSADQIAKLKPSYAWGWKARNDAIKAGMANHDFQAVGKTMAYIKSTLEARIPIVLNASQKAQWKKWQADQEAMRSRMRQGMGGGGKGAPAGKK